MASPILDSGDFCSDALIEILLKIPFEFLKKFYFVSKNWATFLSHPSFNRLYFNKNHSNQVLVFPGDHKQLYFLRHIEPPTFECFSHQYLPLECHDMLLMGSCQGILGFYTSFWKYSGSKAFIWNPTIKVGKLFDLPLSKDQSVSVGLGYDSSKEDFAVIQLLSSSSETVVQVYSCKDAGWTELTSVQFFADSPNCRFILNGAPHWEGTTDIEYESAVFSFDPTTNSHKLIPYPMDNTFSTVFLVKVRDSIVLLSFSETNNKLDAFFYDGVGWVKQFVIGPLQNLFEIDVLQFFEDAIISRGLPWDTNIQDVKRNVTLPMSELLSLLEPKIDQSYIHVETLFDVPGGQLFYPRSVMEVFRDFEGGRASFIRSLTSESKKRITLYGLPSNEWKTEERVRPVGRDQSSGVKVLRQPPKPAFGFNFAEKVMKEYDWLSFAASQGDGWLTSNASHFADLYEFNLADRQRLFTLMNDLSTIHEVVTEATKNLLLKDEDGCAERKRLFTLMNDLSTVHEVVTEATKNLQLKDEDGEDLEAVDDKDDSATICETCGESSGHDEFAVCCDSCVKIFYYKCAKIALPRAEHFEQHRCSSCSKKRAQRY